MSGKEDDDVWIEKEELTPAGKALTDIVRKMSIVERANAVLDMLAHDQDVMDIVRSRMNWEIRNAVVEGMNEMGRDFDEVEMLRTFGSILSDECDSNMGVAYPELFKEHTSHLKTEKIF